MATAKGDAKDVVAGWARVVRSGATPLYGTSWENAASQAVAKKLRLAAEPPFSCHITTDARDNANRRCGDWWIEAPRSQALGAGFSIEIAMRLKPGYLLAGFLILVAAAFMYAARIRFSIPSIGFSPTIWSVVVKSRGVGLIPVIWDGLPELLSL